LADAAGLAGQNQEAGLERVLRLVRITEHASADAHHQRTVPADDDRKGRLVALDNETLQQLGVAEVLVPVSADEPADVTEHARDLLSGHANRLHGDRLSPFPL